MTCVCVCVCVYMCVHVCVCMCVYVCVCYSTVTLARETMFTTGTALQCVPPAQTRRVP